MNLSDLQYTTQPLIANFVSFASVVGGIVSADLV